jgi:hypothetical protein
MGGAIGLGIPVGPFHILKPAESPEVVFLVVIDRRLVAQKSPPGMRVGLQ